MALVEDPDYAKAILRKIQIMDRKGEYSSAHNMANFAMARFDDEFEEAENRKLVPKFRELRDRLKILMQCEQTQKQDRLEEEVEKELGLIQFPETDFAGFGTGLENVLGHMTDQMNDKIE